jgi:DNA helicase HerA-like ATPase
VTYFLPRGKDGRPNSMHIPSNSKTYSYELNDVYDRLELLFSEIYDPRYNLSSIINYIYEFWPIKKSSSIKKDNDVYIKTWTDLFNFRDYPEEIITHKSSLLHFQGHIQRFRRSSLFIDKKVTSKYLGKEIRQINSHDIFVVDIAMLSTVEEQSFVIGDVMKSIDEMYSSNEIIITSKGDRSTAKEVNQKKKPRYVLVFIDEINRFLPISKPTGKMKPVGEQIVKTVIAGRSRGTILFSAQQFKSTVDPSLHESTGMHIIAKMGLSELSTALYSMIDESTKMNIVRLNKGELVIIHSAFRYPIKITFPRPSFKDR